MTRRDQLLPVFDRARAKIAAFGLRQNGLSVVTRTWTGGLGPPNSFVDAVLAISPTPRIRDVSMRELVGSGGQYQVGDIRVDRITPAYTVGAVSGGYTAAQLVPTGSALVEIIYRVTGPLAGDYLHVDDSLDRNFGYTLVIRRTNRTP